jgi:hypothetical protein
MWDQHCPCLDVRRSLLRLIALATTRRPEGRVRVTAAPTRPGPLDWSPYVLPRMIHEDWRRPLHIEDDGDVPCP